MSPFAILATAASYLVLLFAVAWISSRKADNQTFFVGSRRSPWWAVALGMIAAPMSGVTFVSVPGMVGASSWAYLQMALGFIAGYLVIALILIPLYYRAGIVSIYQYLETRFGLSSYHTGAWFFFISKMLGAAVRIYLVCLVLQMLVFQPLGVPFVVNVGAMMLLVWLYTFRGGVRSLVWTDALKTLFLVGSLALCIYFISRELGFDFGALTKAVRNSELSRIWFFDDPLTGRYFFKQFFAGLFIVVAMTGLDQDMMQVSLSCRNPRDAQKNLLTASLLQFVIIVMFLCLGTLLYLFAAARGLAAPSAGPTGDELFPYVAVHSGLPIVVGVVFVLGLISSTYSAAGSALTALTTSFTVDILGADKQTGENHLARTRRLVHIGMAVAMALVIIAFRALNSTSVIDAVYTLASYTYGPLLGMFAFGVLTGNSKADRTKTCRRKTDDRFVPLVALLSPALCLVLDLNSEAWFGGYQFSYEILILNALFTFAGLAILTKKCRAATSRPS